jgi:hypothetical protein
MFPKSPRIIKRVTNGAGRVAASILYDENTG